MKIEKKQNIHMQRQVYIVTFKQLFVFSFTHQQLHLLYHNLNLQQFEFNDHLNFVLLSLLWSSAAIALSVCVSSLPEKHHRLLISWGATLIQIDAPQLIEAEGQKHRNPTHCMARLKLK